MDPYEYLMTRLGFWFVYVDHFKILKFRFGGEVELRYCGFDESMEDEYGFIWENIKIFNDAEAELLKDNHCAAALKHIYSIFVNLPREFNSIKEVDLALVLNGLY